ncbi:MAG: DNA polymerase III subunit delta [Planctomycetaceae bacterium]
MADAPVAIEILRHPDRWSPPPAAVLALVGDEPFLAGRMLLLLRDRLVPDDADRSWAWREFDGDQIEDARDVFDEVATVPLFGDATRVAVVRGADPFVTRCRPALEALAAAPRGARGVVVLVVKSLPSNTRLAKALAAAGGIVDLAVPQRADLAAWVRQWASSHHRLALEPATAERLLERLGRDLGQVDQVLKRVAAARAADAGAVRPEEIDDVAGSAQERSAWGMVDDAASGDAGKALAALADLLAAGESPVALLAQSATSLRRLATAARILAPPPGAARPPSFDEALKRAGVAAWPKALAQAREALQQLGRQRALRLPQALADLDRALKGEASRGLRARLALERLVCMMARETPPGRVAGPRRGAAPADHPGDRP